MRLGGLQMIYRRLEDLAMATNNYTTRGVLREGHETYSLWAQWVSASGCRPSQEMLRGEKYWAMLQVRTTELGCIRIGQLTNS